MTFRDLNFILKLEMAAKTFMLFDWLTFLPNLVPFVPVISDKM
jgi:hypothetical protein